MFACVVHDVLTGRTLNQDGIALPYVDEMNPKRRRGRSLTADT
jgi:hypothetical protein